MISTASVTAARIPIFTSLAIFKDFSIWSAKLL